MKRKTMNMHMRQLGAISFALLLLAGTAVSAVGCGGSEKDSGQAETTAKETETAAVTEKENPYQHALGDFDFGGETFTMYTRNTEWLNCHMNTEATDGTTLNDEIYERNRRLEDTYHFQMEELYEDMDTKQARTAVAAGEDVYDIINTRCVYAFNYAMEGLLYTINELPHVDLSRPYWDEELTEAVSIGGKKYFAVGDFNLSGYDFTHMLAFNKAIAGQHDFDIYQMVLDGKWTYDAMESLMKDVTADANGDGKMAEQDNYGFLSAPKQILPSLWISAGQLSIQMDDRGYPTFSMLTDESFADVFERIFDLVYDGNVWQRNQSSDNVPKECVDMFINGQGLFLDLAAFYLETLRGMDTDFGLIPFPKLDENQESYYSRIEGCEQFCIPVTNSKLEMTGVIMEAMASDSAQHLIPAYYDTMLKSKYARDDDSEKMLDIIFGSRVFDWGDTIWCGEIRDGKFQHMMKDNNRDLASTAARMEKMMNEKIQKVIETFEKIE